MEDRIEKLKRTISVLEESDPKSSKLQGFKDELKKLTKSSPGATAGTFVIPGATEEDWEKTSSQFPQAGIHLSEFGIPYEKTPGTSLAFPFTIVSGVSESKEGIIYAGLGKDARWKLKEILNALGVEIQKTKGGGIGFDFAEVAGKQAQVIYKLEPDKRPLSEGGTGGSFPKASTVLPIGAEIPETLM